MKTIIFGGQKVDVCEHMSEIKAKTDYFNRFYNRKQMLKYYLDNFTICENGTEYEDHRIPEERFGIASGRRIILAGGGIYDDCSIAFIKIEDIYPRAITDCLDCLSDNSDNCFFMESNEGQIYLIYIEED